MQLKRGPKNLGVGRPPPPSFGQCPKENVFFCIDAFPQAMRLSLIFPENVFFCEKADVDIKGLHHKLNAVIWPTNKKVITTFQTILQNMLSVGSKHNCSNFWSTGTISFKGQPNFSVDISNKKSKTSLFKSFLRKERKWCTNFQV